VSTQNLVALAQANNKLLTLSDTTSGRSVDTTLCNSAQIAKAKTPLAEMHFGMTERCQ
jgi:hypothetical protein